MCLLSAHMVQHLLLMSAVPPLLLLGWPVVPLLRGLPAWILRPVLGPLLRLSPLRRFGRWLISPPVAWIAMNVIFLGWHVPAAYDFALQHECWHDFEHICFLASSLAFWWCVIRPWPTQKRGNSWGLLLYLLSADLVNTALSAFLAFCDSAGLQLLPQSAQSVSCLAAFGSDSGSGHYVGGVVRSFFLRPRRGLRFNFAGAFGENGIFRVQRLTLNAIMAALHQLPNSFAAWLTLRFAVQTVHICGNRRLFDCVFALLEQSADGFDLWDQGVSILCACLGSIALKCFTFQV